MKQKSNFHIPVLKEEVINALAVKAQEKYIDATIGGGGHTFEILKRGGKILGIDYDREAIEYTSGKWKIESRKWKVKENNLVLVQGNFRDIKEIARLHGFEKVSGILFDLGLSSHQLDRGERGFSFKVDASLDMRMDQSLTVKAADLVNGLTKGELYELFNKLGQEALSMAISDHIIRARQIRPITTTSQLADLVIEVYGGRGKVGGRPARLATRSVAGRHPATRVFQALRIAVNDELNNLRQALPEGLELLKRGGRLVAISFHSLEDGIVKNTFRDWAGQGKVKILTHKPVVPSYEEILTNPRARSAKMRAIQAL